MPDPSPSLPLRCACGALRGQFDATPSPGARGVCYCDDCQAYGRWIGTPGLLDAHGGTEVIQSWPARVRLEVAGPPLALMKLSEKGLHRWYAACCRTPLANTMASPRMPFTGVLRRAIDADDARLDALYGPARGVQGRFAVGGCPPGAHPSASLGIIGNAVGLIVRGAFAGGHAPSPFFGPDGQPVVAPLVLSPEERRALYPGA